jgi:zinc protease
MNLIKPANWKTLPGPENITRMVLPNGITLLTRSNFNSPSVFAGGYMTAGSMFDPSEKLGLSHFTSICLMRGTQARKFQEIYNILESAGASLGFGASVHNMNFGGRALTEDLPVMLNLAAEALRNPTFPPEHVERLRAQILTSLAIRNQDTGEMADLTCDEILFQKHPYGLPDEGYPETIRAIQRSDLVEFHQAYYRPENLVMVIVGAVEPTQALEFVQEALGNWNNPLPFKQPVYPAFAALNETVSKHIAMQGKYQSDLIIGTHAPRRLSDDFMAVSLGNSILGQFGMMGRIGDVVREKAGLAYSASTGLSSSVDGGSWEVSAGVNPSNLQRAIDLIISELERFTEEPVTLEELQDSQANFIGRLPLSLESNAGVANALLNVERFQLGLDYYQRYPDLVQAVTPEAILEAARRYWHLDCLAIVSAGPEQPA